MKRTKQLIISLIALLCCSTGVWAEGELKGLFSINENGDKVQFSQGNLQATYDGSDWSWAFAKNQWDYIGNAAANTSINGNGTVSTNGTVDLFSVSTSATTYGIHNSTSYETYSGDFVDWGNNMGDGWRTLASNEWNYIFMKRNSGSQVSGASNARYTHATINTDGTPINGIILFPDGVTITYSEVTSWGTINGESEWGTKCTSAQWTALEFKGCVFLPAAGWRYGAEVSYAGDEGFYLSSNTWEVSGEWPVCFRSNYLSSSGSTSRHLGCSVRLVKDRQLNKDADGYYLLGTVDDWRFFAAHVAAGYSGANARMTADIDLGDDQTTIGSGNTNAANANVMFRGVFDGNGHTLTVNYNTSEGFYAPIRHISGATIKNLHVTGSIISSGGRVGGIVCGVFGGSSTQSKIEKCRSSVVITSNCQVAVSDAESVGGIVGQVGFSSRLSIEDCIFDGEITGHVSNVIWSGLVGVLDGTVNTTRCLQAGSFNDLDNGTTSNSATIVCRWQNAATSIVTMDETYYIHPFKTVQGTQATTAQLADGTITTALNAGRTGNDAVWVQQDDQPMLKIFTQESDPVEPTVWENGVLPGEFTINANGDQIVFSQGNLQYQATTDTWRFAINQYDFVGAGNANISDTYDGWIDLIQWGAGNNPTTTALYKYQTFVEFGTHPISNGGNVADAWRTLTKDEWVYIFRDRTNAERLFAFGSVNGVNGLIILPDNWTTPDGLTFSPSTEHGLTWLTSDGYYKSDTADGFSHNVYTLEQWTTMENQGAVFLPAAGIRYIGTKNLQKLGTEGYYWSSDKTSSDHAYVAGFGANILNPQHNGMQDYGQSIRLVQAANSKPTYLVGDANGNGEVEIGDVTSVLTLMATPEAIGYDNQAADANGNGEIEIGDVTTILTIMANGE